MLLERARIIAHIDRLLGVTGKKLHIKYVAGKYYLKNSDADTGKTHFKHFRFWLRVEEHRERSQMEEGMKLKLRDRDLDTDWGERDEDACALFQKYKKINEDTAKIDDAKVPAAPAPMPKKVEMALDAAVAAGAAASIATAKRGGRRGSTSGSGR